MFTSERYLTRLARLRKEHRDAPLDDQVALARDAFIGLFPGLPKLMVEEIHDAFSDRISSRLVPGELYLERASYLADIADLFNGQYDEQNDPIHEDDWSLVSEIVNDYAIELDMGIVNYVMRLVVDHHGW
jgi:hypothetical protein